MDRGPAQSRVCPQLTPQLLCRLPCASVAIVSVNDHTVSFIGHDPPDRRPIGSRSGAPRGIPLSFGDILLAAETGAALRKRREGHPFSDDSRARPAERSAGPSCARSEAEMGSVPPGLRNVRARQKTSRHHCRLGAEQRGSRVARRVRPFSGPVHIKPPWTFLRRRSSYYPRRLSVRRTLERNDCSPADRRA